MNYKLTNKIEVSDFIFRNEYEYTYGNRRDENVKFYYIHKNGVESHPRLMTYNNALSFAVNRSADGRYKNYTYYICEDW